MIRFMSEFARSCRSEMSANRSLSGVKQTHVSIDGNDAIDPEAVMYQTYSITSSAAASSVVGTVRPSILAVWRLMANSNLRRLHNRQVRRLGALEDATGIDADLTIRIRNVGSVAHQSAGFGKVTNSSMLRGLCLVRRCVGQLNTPVVEEGVAADEEGVGPLAHEGCEDRIDLAAGAGAEDLDL